MFGRPKKLDVNRSTGLLNEPKCATCKAPIFISWKTQGDMDKLGVNRRNLGDPLMFPPKEGTHAWFHMDDPQHIDSDHNATPHDNRTLQQQHDNDFAVSTMYEHFRQTFPETMRRVNQKNDERLEEMKNDKLNKNQFGEH